MADPSSGPSGRRWEESPSADPLSPAQSLPPLRSFAPPTNRLNVVARVRLRKRRAKARAPPERISCWVIVRFYDRRGRTDIAGGRTKVGRPPAIRRTFAVFPRRTESARQRNVSL